MWFQKRSRHHQKRSRHHHSFNSMLRFQKRSRHHLHKIMPNICEAIAPFHLHRNLDPPRNPKFDSEVDMKSSFYSKISPAVKPMGNETPKVVSCDILLQVPWRCSCWQNWLNRCFFGTGFHWQFICAYFFQFSEAIAPSFDFASANTSKKIARTYNSNLISDLVTYWWLHSSRIPDGKVLFRTWNPTVETRLQSRPKTKSFGISNFGKAWRGSAERCHIFQKLEVTVSRRRGFLGEFFDSGEMEMWKFMRGCGNCCFSSERMQWN